MLPGDTGPSVLHPKPQPAVAVCIKGMTMKLAWCADLHLDHAGDEGFRRFAEEVNNSGADMLVVCGDICGGTALASWLRRLGSEIQCPTKFVLGNHDAYGQSLVAARQTARDLSGRGLLLFDRTPNVSWLSDGTMETLSDDTVLIGNDGWYDARAGTRGRIIMNDFRYIYELRTPFFIAVGLHEEIQRIADEAAKQLDEDLSKALTHRRKVILATHVPPFPQAAWYQGRQSEPEYLPYFCSVCAGNVLVKHMGANSDKELLVLCGHTHGKGEAQILPNLKVLTAGAQYGKPRLQRVIEI